MNDNKFESMHLTRLYSDDNFQFQFWSLLFCGIRGSGMYDFQKRRSNARWMFWQRVWSAFSRKGSVRCTAVATELARFHRDSLRTKLPQYTVVSPWARRDKSPCRFRIKVSRRIVSRLLTKIFRNCSVDVFKQFRRFFGIENAKLLIVRRMLEFLWFWFNGLCALLADAARLESVALHKMIITTNYYYLRQEGYVFTGVS